jgi:hypothetical protein
MICKVKKGLITFSVIATTLLSCQVIADDQADNIDYQIMVQRATQTAIWAMPGVALVDFTKATKRDLGGKMNDVVYLTKPLNSNHGFLPQMMLPLMAGEALVQQKVLL